MTEKVGLRMGRASAVRLSQHLDLSAQLEVLQLKEKLQEMTDMVRQLLQHMDQLEKIPGFFSKEGTQKDRPTVATQTNLSEEKSLEMSPTQKSKMKELVDMNLNWQKYNALQEKHIQELHDKVEQLQRKLTTVEDNSLLLQQQLQDENNRLKAEVEKFRLRNDALQASASEAKGKKAGNMEREQLLEAQLMVYKEDFQTERKDREAAQARVVQLEMELLEANKKMQTTSTGYHNYRAPRYQTDGGDLQLDGGEFHHDNDNSTTENLATDSADGPPSWNAVLQAEHSRENKVSGGKLRRPACVDNKMSGIKEDALCCTKCFKVYPQSEHLELLDHLEECGRQ